MQGPFALLFGAFLVASAVVLYFLLHIISRRDVNPWRNERVTESMRRRGRLLVCGLLAGVGVYVVVFYGTGASDVSARSVRFPLAAIGIGITWLTFRQEIAAYQRRLVPRQFATGEDPVGALRKLGSLFAVLMIGLGLLLLVLLGLQEMR